MFKVKKHIYKLGKKIEIDILVLLIQYILYELSIILCIPIKNVLNKGDSN